MRRRRLSPDEDRAIARGLLAQPAVAAVVGFVLSSWSIEMGLVMAVLFAITAAVITVCCAYPLLLWFLNRERVTVVTTLVSGALLGNLPAAIAYLGTFLRSVDGTLDLHGLVRPAGVGTLVGLLGASAFWLFAGHQVARGPRLQAPSRS